MKAFVCVLVSVLIAAQGVGCAEAEPVPPNIVFVLADDLGWRDVGYNGSTFYQTPNIDQLAADGTVFTDAYAASPLCSPTRAAFLTGKAPARLWLTHALTQRDFGKGPGPGESAAPGDLFVEPVIRDRLPSEETTLAERLREAGYRTALVGKWHLGPPDWVPEDHGFEFNIGGDERPGPSSYFSPFRLPNLADTNAGEYLTDRLTDEAIRFMTEHRAEPFFLYLSHYAVHSPWQAKQSLIQHYRERVVPDAGQRNPIYAAMIQSLDESVGRVRAALERLGIAERTIVVFTSDNGGLHVPPIVLSRRRNVPPHYKIPVTSNAPLRGGKGTIFEGGIRVPCIVSWPGVTTKGSTSATPIVTMDFYRTFLGAAGLQARSGEAPDGVDLAPLLRRSGAFERDRLYFHLPHARLDPLPGAAIRDGDWKLIHRFGAGDELYDLSSDPGETQNVAAQLPELRDRLREELRAWLGEVDAQLPRMTP